MAPEVDPRDRRQFPRLQAPIFFRTSRFSLSRRVVDVSVGGVRIFSDAPFEIDQRLDLELFLPDGKPLRCQARVAWIAMLPRGSAAKYDVGLQLSGVSEQDTERLSTVLEACADVMPPPIPKQVPASR